MQPPKSDPGSSIAVSSSFIFHSSPPPPPPKLLGSLCSDEFDFPQETIGG